MDEKQLQALANELAKNIKTPEDLSQFDRLLKKISPNRGPTPAMTIPQRLIPPATAPWNYVGRLLRTATDKKNQTWITGMDNQILSLYVKGMTTREIAAWCRNEIKQVVLDNCPDWTTRPLSNRVSVVDSEPDVATGVMNIQVFRQSESIRGTAKRVIGQRKRELGRKIVPEAIESVI